MIFLTRIEFSNVRLISDIMTGFSEARDAWFGKTKGSMNLLWRPQGTLWMFVFVYYSQTCQPRDSSLLRAWAWKQRNYIYNPWIFQDQYRYDRLSVKSGKIRLTQLLGLCSQPQWSCFMISHLYCLVKLGRLTLGKLGWYCCLLSARIEKPQLLPEQIHLELQRHSIPYRMDRTRLRST